MLNRVSNPVSPRTLAVLCVAAAAGTAFSQQTIQLPNDFASLQDALNPAVSGLAPGDTIVLSDSVVYRGTFSVTTPDVTIRAAAGQSPVLDANGPGTVVTVNIGNGSLTLEGLTIQDGTNQGTNQRGSGIDVVNAGVLTLRGCTVQNNSSDNGGGLFASNTDVVVEDSVFRNNTAPNGGGMRIIGTSGVTLRGTVFTNNTAVGGFGGGLDLDVNANGSLVMEGCDFSENTAGNRGGGARISEASNVTITGSDFTDNTATGNNVNDGGGIFFFGPQFVDMRGCTFERNLATDAGGAFYADQVNADTLRFIDVRFEDNTSTRGGAVYLAGGNEEFVSCRFTGNSASLAGEGQGSGGALHIQQFNDSNRASAVFFNSVFEGNTAGRAGAIHLTHRCSAEVIGSTFVGNVAADRGGAIDVSATGVNVSIHNSIFAGNTPSLDQVNIQQANGTEIASFNLFDAEGLIGNGENNLLNTNPLFADQVGGDYSLLAGSPAIDAGNSELYVGGPFADFAGNGRGQDDPDTADTGVAGFGPVMDMGAFEFKVLAAAPDCPADLAAPEGVLDLSDISTFIQAFQAGCP